MERRYPFLIENFWEQFRIKLEGNNPFKEGTNFHTIYEGLFKITNKVGREITKNDAVLVIKQLKSDGVHIPIKNEKVVLDSKSDSNILLNQFLSKVAPTGTLVKNGQKVFKK